MSGRVNKIRGYSNTTFSMVTIIVLSSLLGGLTTLMEEDKLNLPKTIGAWTRPDSPQIITSENIFDYMDGAGELYLGYRFDHLEVYEFTADNQDDILVELYFMKSSDDAFGLLSQDWGGDPVDFESSSVSKATQNIAPSHRALYGGGLLRIWSDNLYIRIMAYRETPESKEAVLSLGQAIAENRKHPPQPQLLQILHLTVDSDWKLRSDRIAYFRSYLVLNSFYYLSHENILNLDLSTEAVTAPYENITTTGERKRVQFLFIKYENPERSEQALDNFLKAYLPEHKKDFTPGSTAKSSNFYEVEDGWLGYQLFGKCIALVFGCPHQESAQMIINQMATNLSKIGAVS